MPEIRRLRGIHLAVLLWTFCAAGPVLRAQDLRDFHGDNTRRITPSLDSRLRHLRLCDRWHRTDGYPRDWHAEDR